MGLFTAIMKRPTRKGAWVTASRSVSHYASQHERLLLGIGSGVLVAAAGLFGFSAAKRAGWIGS